MEDAYIAIDFFKNQGLDEARKITKQLGHLNCCKDVSNAVEKLALFYDIACETVPVKVYTADNFGTDHYVISYKNILIDYTKAQFFGYNNIANTRCDIIEKYIKGDNTFFTNNVFYFKEQDAIYGTTDLMDLISKINNKEIVPDNLNYIIYQINL